MTEFSARFFYAPPTRYLLLPFGALKHETLRASLRTSFVDRSKFPANLVRVHLRERALVHPVFLDRVFIQLDAESGLLVQRDPTVYRLR